MSQEPEHEAVAAVPGEALLALATRVKEDPTCPETLPAVPTMATEDWSKWSTLPGDLVRRIGDSFLAIHDLDYYMCFRAVCPSWRAATDDPNKNNSDDRFLRFHPLLWIILDEDFQGDDRRVLLNTFTGRFLRKKLPTLLDCYVVGTSGGFFVLADRSPPHAARVFNPLTGYMLRFAAPVPPDVSFSDVVISDYDSLVLSFFCDSSRKIHTAAANDEHFSVSPLQQASYDIIRKLVVGDVYLLFHHSGPSTPGIILQNFFDEVPLSPAVLEKVFSCDFPAHGIRGFLVDLHLHICLVLKHPGCSVPFVFLVDAKTGEVLPLEGINRFAIFIGNHRCLALDTHIFPSIEANCLYFTEHLDSSAHICKSNIKDGKAERISEAADFVKQDKKFVLVGDRPFTLIQLLASYTINLPDSQLALQHVP